MNELLPLVTPLIIAAALLIVLVGLQPGKAFRPAAGMAWCLAGAFIFIAMTLGLVDAKDMLSPEERLAQWNGGVWRPLSGLGGGDVSWRFHISPLASSWGALLGALAAALGWQAHRTKSSLPCGALGIGLWLATIGLLIANDLLIAFLLAASQTVLVGLWLASQAETTSAQRDVRTFLRSLLVSDSLGLVGVLLTGTAWKTFDLARLGDIEFIRRGWEAQPASCGLAGTFLTLGLLGRCGLLPFTSATAISAEIGGLASGLAWSIGLWPSALWLFVRVQPVLGVVPETSSLVQGLMLLAAVCGAFFAAGQPNPKRAVALLASSQLGLIMSALVLPSVSSPVWITLTMGVVAVATAGVFMNGLRGSPEGWVPSLGQRLAIGLAFATLSGVFPSPVFWMAGRSVITFEGMAATPGIQDGDPLPVNMSRPLPTTTWMLAWSLWSFFAAFAAWRARRTERCLGAAHEVSSQHGSSSPTWIGLGALLVAGIVWASRLAWSEIDSVFRLSPVAGASLAGFAAAAWLCRDPKRIAERWSRLGSWTHLAERELYLPDVWTRIVAIPLKDLAEVVRAADDSLIASVGAALQAAIREGVDAVKELRQESSTFYAGAIVMTIGAVAVAWLVAGG